MSEHADRSSLDVLVPTRARPDELAVTLAELAGPDHPFDVASANTDGAPSYASPTGAAVLIGFGGSAAGKRGRVGRAPGRRGSTFGGAPIGYGGYA